MSEHWRDYDRLAINKNRHDEMLDGPSTRERPDHTCEDDLSVEPMYYEDMSQDGGYRYNRSDDNNRRRCPR